MIAEHVVEACARHAHEINRAYCAALGDASQVPWDEAPQWQRDSCIAGARATLKRPDQTPEDSHAFWMAHKQAEGWVYGQIKDHEAKKHPCMVPYEELPSDQRAKDYIFRAAVLGMAAAFNAPEVRCVVTINGPIVDPRIGDLVAEYMRRALEGNPSAHLTTSA